MRILALDMGTRNTAWCQLKNDKVLSYGMFENPISELTDGFRIQKLRFLREYKKLTCDMKLENGDAIIAERFQMRRFNPGAQIEMISVMLGMMAAAAPTRFYMTVAGNWKNHISMNYTNIPEINKKRKRGEKIKFEMEDYLEGTKYAEYEHICDAIGIGQYFYEIDTGIQSKFLKRYKGNKKWK